MLLLFCDTAVPERDGPTPIRYQRKALHRQSSAVSSCARRSERAHDTERHCVWRVTNVPVPFYLVGTIHSLRPGDYPLPEVYRRALNDSKRLLFEYNPKERAAYEKKFRAAGQYPEGKDIRSSIRPETLALLHRNSRMFRLRFDELSKYKPWALAFRLWSIRIRRGDANLQRRQLSFLPGAAIGKGGCWTRDRGRARRVLGKCVGA